MDKLKMHTPNRADENFQKLAALFPNAVTETIDENGEVVRAIDKDVLMQEISATVVEGREERYQFTWPDKKKAILTANAPIAKTLRPCREESVNFDTTENLYIEGDNLDVLKLLRETYLGKVKMIYIDPPYNTGNDFVYNDDFAESTEDYLANSGQFDEDGNRLVQNTESNGRFHTDWLNMIYPRLKIARDLLTDDGVIFISIDDREMENAKKICDEIYGHTNYIASIVWQKKYAPQNDARYFSTMHEYVLCYAKNNCLSDNDIGWKRILLPRSDEQNSRYKNPDNDPRGPWKAADLTSKTKAAGHSYPIITPSGREVLPAPGRQWAPAYKTFCEMVKDNRIWFGNNGDNVPSQKVFLSEVQNGQVPNTIWFREEVGDSQSAVKEMNILMNCKAFDTPKPTSLILRIIQLSTSDNDIILDFFSGSATTAHAVMQLNFQKAYERKLSKIKFIMVQLPEETAEKSEAYKAGYKNICEIGKERIRRAGKREYMSVCSTMGSSQRWDRDKRGVDMNYPCPESVDIGFRVLKLDSTNMKDVYYTPAEFVPTLLDELADNIKEDRTPEDLLFQVMLDLGVLLSDKIEETEIDGKKVFSVADGYLIACFDANVTEETITAIAKQKPYYFVMRDSSMANDSVATNFEQIFATYSPDTVRKVL